MSIVLSEWQAGGSGASHLAWEAGRRAAPSKRRDAARPAFGVLGRASDVAGAEDRPAEPPRPVRPPD